ncbi:hypothetical protein SteCoe_28483 [Stentor coeruleus]|uniref:Uncharacterized protein n=1 Tax=Stentor coeruleus TaxID=5963 RepID=A0A1R2B839_9CILI|nr:hypothetical protein SteCoe_28483 [Stentor coeruleus]
MRFLRWMNLIKDASVHHDTADKLSKNKTFQKVILSIYRTPLMIKKALEDDENISSKAKADKPQKRLESPKNEDK